MNAIKMRMNFFQKYGMFFAIILGILVGMYGPSWSTQLTEAVRDVFMRLLKFVSLPIISLSLMATISGLDKSEKLWKLSKRVTLYTIATTLLSATLALFLFEMVQPVEQVQYVATTSIKALSAQSYCAELVKVIPDNILKPFVDYHVISVFIVSIMIGLAVLSLPDNHRLPMSQSLHRIFLVIMELTRWIVLTLPIAVVAFIALFVQELRSGFEMGTLGKYLGVVVSANMIHGFVLLPLLLLLHKIPVMRTLKGMFPVLSLAFFSKSSSACIPSAIQTAEKSLDVDPTVSRFTFPLCTTINMNACAAFILTTFLFVAQTHGMTFTWASKLLWILIATAAALGNAGVPMGCFFLTNALLTAFNIPVELMGVILPFYGLLDMVESSVNVWSDSCVTVMVDKWWKKQHTK